MKQQPLRMCIVTKQMFPKSQLVRIVKTPEGHFVLDATGKQNGRGAYVSNFIENFETIKKKRILNKVFGMSVSIEVYDELKEAFLATRKQDN